VITGGMEKIYEVGGAKVSGAGSRKGTVSPPPKFRIYTLEMVYVG